MSSTEVDQDALIGMAARLLPGVNFGLASVCRGQFHDVLLVPGVAAVRVARRPAAAAELPRRMELLRRLRSVSLPFEVPEPLTEVTEVDGFVAAAVSWIPGRPLPRGEGDPAQLSALLAALREVCVEHLHDVLDQPHAYAGREQWYELMVTEAVPRLPAQLRPEAQRRVDAAAELAPIEPCLVHGDLGGDNLRWTEDGELIGVLDWDLAQPFDPALDAACLAWHGWDNVRAAVDAETYRRARVWWQTFGIEQIVSAIVNGEPEQIVGSYVDSATKWLAQQHGD